MTMRFAIVPLALALGAMPAAAQTVWDGPRQLAPAQQTTIQRTVVRERAAGPQKKYTQREIRRTTLQPATRVVTRQRVVIRPVVRERIVVRPVLRERVVTVIAGGPLALTQNQMNFLYDSIIAQPVQPRVVVTQPSYSAPFVTAPGRPLVTLAEPDFIEPVARERYITTAPIMASPSTRRVITTGPATTGFGVPAALAVGEPVPSWVQLYTLPRATIAAMPELGRYYYTVAGDRVFLVDPTDNVVVTEFYR